MIAFDYFFDCYNHLVNDFIPIFKFIFKIYTY